MEYKQLLLYIHINIESLFVLFSFTITSPKREKHASTTRNKIRNVCLNRQAYKSASVCASVVDVLVDFQRLHTIFRRSKDSRGNVVFLNFPHFSYVVVGIGKFPVNSGRLQSILVGFMSILVDFRLFLVDCSQFL